MGDIEPGGPARRASDEDREGVASLLRDHCAQGRLSLDELSSRLDVAYRAQTLNDLAKLTEDLPTPAPPRPSPRRRRRVHHGFRRHLGVYAIVNLFLIGIWALTSPGGYFWPIWPIMGWGIGIALHAWGSLAGAHEEPAFPSPVDRHRHGDRAERHRARFGEWPSAPVPTVPPQRAALPWVAVMFTDIADSTRLTEAMGDEEWARLRVRHRELLRECFQRHSGREVGAQGDGFLARFTSPLEAAECAVDVQQRLEHAREAAGFAPKVRIGIHAGRVVEDEDDLVGAVVNLASRVTADADPGEILVTEPVADYVGGRLRLEDRGLRTLRGVAQPRHLLAVDWQGR